MKNKPIYLFGIISLLLAMMACSVFSGGGGGEEIVSTDEPASSEDGSGSNDPTEEPPAVVSNLCENEYYPVVEGGTWSYYGTSSATEDYTFTNTITSVRDDGFTVTVEFDNLTLVQEWACTPEGILALTAGGGPAGTLTTSDVNLVMDTQNASGLTYPKNIQPGSTWDATLDYTGTMDIAGQTVNVSGNTVYNYTAIEIESVTVQAGTFDAMKVDVVITINIISDIQGSSVPVTFSSTTTSWFAPGVGWVKSDSSSDFGGFSSSEASELVSYNIP